MTVTFEFRLYNQIGFLDPLFRLSRLLSVAITGD